MGNMEFEKIKIEKPKKFVSVSKTTLIDMARLNYLEANNGKLVADDLTIPDRPEPGEEIVDLSLLKPIKERVFEIFKEFIVYEPDDPEEARLMEFDHEITQDECDLGLSDKSKGTTIRHWITVNKFVRLLYPVLSLPNLSYDINADQEAKSRDLISHIIAYLIKYQLGHHEYLKIWRYKNLI